MAIPINPYVAGNPVGDTSAFVGRADALREVLHVLSRPRDNAIVLYGQRRIGKTSILQYLEAWLPNEGPYCPVYFDLEDKAALPLNQVLRELARAIAHALGKPDPNLGSDPEVAFRHEWLPAVLDSMPEDCSLVLLFDEFDVLADSEAKQAAAAFSPYLRPLLASDPGRLQSVFVIGRNVGDLDNIARSLFKSIPAMRVSLLDREDAADLVRLSEANGTLRWPDEAAERVWALTCGHPYLTQQLCSYVWHRAYDEEDGEPDEPPTVAAADVDAAVLDTLESSRNTLEWLWGGLPPAARVVAAALAEAGPDPITQQELEELLSGSGVRIVIRELQNAPRLLQELDLIEPADGGYRFRVELLRRWIADHKPLRRVRDELDRIEPVAENYYQAAVGLYRGGELDQAIAPLRQATRLNPNHVGASQLLADILLAQGQVDEARELLERLYEYQPAVARPRLVQAILTQAQAAESEDEQLVLYRQVLELAPAQREATAKVAEIERERRRRDLAPRSKELEMSEKQGGFQRALALVRRLVGKYLGMRDWRPNLERLERKAYLDGLYERGVSALQSGDRETAQTLLAQVIAEEPGHEEATRYLHLAVTGEDIRAVQAQLEAERKAHRNADTIAREKVGPDRIRLEGSGGRQRDSDVSRDDGITRLVDTSGTEGGLSVGVGLTPIIRTKDYDKVKNHIEQGRSCLVVGLPYMGKTSLIGEIQREFSQGGYTTLILDSEGLRGIEEFWQSLYQRLLWPRTASREATVSLVAEIAKHIRSSEQVHVLIIDEIDRLLSTFPEAVKELLIGLKTLLNCGAVVVATSYRDRSIWHDAWRINQDIATLLEQVFSRQVVLAPWNLMDVREFIRIMQVPDSIQSIESSDDLAQLVTEVTGGIPRLVYEVVDRLKSEVQHNWEHTRECDVAQIWRSVLSEIQDSASLFDGFWRGVPVTRQQDLFLAYVWTDLAATGPLSSLSRAEFNRVANQYFSATYSSLAMGPVEQIIGIASTILNGWIERFIICSDPRPSHLDFARLMIQDVVDRNFSDANTLAHYFERLGMSDRFTLATERKQQRIHLWNDFAQRIIGFLLIGLTVLGILKLLGLL